MKQHHQIRPQMGGKSYSRAVDLLAKVDNPTGADLDQLIDDIRHHGVAIVRDGRRIDPARYHSPRTIVEQMANAVRQAARNNRQPVRFELTDHDRTELICQTPPREDGPHAFMGVPISVERAAASRMVCRDNTAYLLSAEET